MWALTEYDQVAFVDADAVLTEHADGRAIFEACGQASFCAVRDLKVSTPREGAPLFNAGLMVVRPNAVKYRGALCAGHHSPSPGRSRAPLDDAFAATRAALVDYGSVQQRNGR